MDSPLNMEPVSIGCLLDGLLDLPLSKSKKVTLVTQDSRRICAGALFLAVAGETTRADAYIGDAVDRGAALVLVDAPQLKESFVRDSKDGADCEMFRIRNLKGLLGEIFSRYYGRVSTDLPVIGVTGTNGKTSVTSFIASALTRIQAKPQGVVGTLGSGIFGALKDTGHTTPNVELVHETLKHIQQQQGSTVSMEVSSHALAQGRVDGLAFQGAVFTNLSRDHLDYHITMEAYGAAKRALFFVNSLQWAVINADDEFGNQLVHSVQVPQLVTYGLQNAKADLVAEKLHFGHQGVSGYLLWQGERHAFHVNLLGRFNIYNVLAVVGTLLCLGVSMEEVVGELPNLVNAPGRMELVSLESGHKAPLVVVDYAHTPDALKNALMALREHSEKSVWCLFGCGGDRDRGKRPEMGAVAAKYADYSIITSDNPRSEEPQAIIDQILEGLDDATDYKVELDRERAIEKVILNASSEDVVLIAGKGHEDYQEINGERIPFSDIAIARQSIQRRAFQ